MYPDLPDYLRPWLKVVFVGFNPGERSARIGHYYAGRGNQFWNFLFESGLTPVRLSPEEDYRMLEFGFGLTDLVKRWSRSINGLEAEDFRQGIPTLKAKLLQASPDVIAFNGKTGFEKFQGRKAELGAQRAAAMAVFPAHKSSVTFAGLNAGWHRDLVLFLHY